MIETKGYLPSTQSAYQKGKSTQNNVYVLAETINTVVELHNQCTISFIDFAAAFDSVSQIFLDQALEEAGASHKSRAIFGSLYDNATAQVRITCPDGTVTLSEPFDLDRGLVQGDCFSALAFIIAVESIMREHDPGGNLSVLGFIVSSLCYADDIALIDKDPEAASARCTALAKSFWSHADMVIALKKTEAMIVRRRVKTDELTPLDYEHASLTHPCESCGRRFIAHLS